MTEMRVVAASYVLLIAALLVRAWQPRLWWARKRAELRARRRRGYVHRPYGSAGTDT